MTGTTEMAAPESISPCGRSVKEALAWGASHLRARGRDAPWLTAELLLAQATGRRRVELLAHPEVRLSGADLQTFRGFVSRRSSGEPVAYVLGLREFFGLEFEVGPGVLVPRPETELIVEWALEFLAGGWRSGPTDRRLEAAGSRSSRGRPAGTSAGARGAASPRPWLADLGCGSGNILGAVLHHRPRALGVGVDVSRTALGWAFRNVKRLRLTDRAMLVEGRMAEALRGGAGGFALITANPPYVQPEEIELLPEEVRDHEPAGALLVPAEDRWRFVREVRGAGERLLRRGGLLLLEVGRGQANRAAALLEESRRLQVCGIRRDLSGIERVVGVRAL